jgi:hypothetical protein
MEYNIDLENSDFADIMIKAIEKDYGRSIARIPYFERAGRHTFEMKVVFTDFRLLEATISIIPDLHFQMIAGNVQIDGTYY